MWRMQVFWIVVVVCIKIASVACHYPEYVVEDLCKFGNETIIYESSQIGQAGTITATSQPPYHANKNCTLLIKPPPGKGVVVSLRKIDLRELRFTCLDYIRIFHSDVFTSPSTICHFLFDLSEKVSFYSIGPMKIIYHVDSNVFRRIGYEQGFTLTFTIVSEDFNDCASSDAFICDNGRCLSKSLTCDGRNNCGDRSDEDRVMCESRLLPLFKISDLLYGIIFSLLVLIVLATFFVVRRRRTQVLLDDAPRLAPPPPYHAVHPTGRAICQNPAGPHSKAAEAGFTNPCYPTGIPNTITDRQF